MVVIVFINLIYLSSSFMKLYERHVDFVNNVTIALSKKERTKIKVVYIEKLYNFIVENVSI